jgi:hypothetical protein
MQLKITKNIICINLHFYMKIMFLLHKIHSPKPSILVPTLGQCFQKGLAKKQIKIFQ